MSSASAGGVDSAAVATLQMICGSAVDKGRATELLEAANGNVERAIDIYFHQQQQEQPTKSHSRASKLSANVSSSSQEELLSIPETPPPSSQTSESEKPPKSAQHTPTRTPTKGKTPCSSSSKQTQIDSFFAGGSPRTLFSPKKKKRKLPSSPTIKHSPTKRPDKDSSTVPTKIAPIKAEPGIESPKPTSLDRQENDAAMSPLKKIQEEPIPEPPAQAEIPFEILAECLQKLTDTTKRLVKLDVLKNFIEHILQHGKSGILSQIKTEEGVEAPSEDTQDLNERIKTLTYALRLILGFRSGDSSQAPLEIGGSALSKALQTILGASRMQLSKGYRQYGDMGDTAASLFQKKTFFTFGTLTASKQLTILQVYESFEKIVSTDGRDAKQHILLQLLRGCETKTELRFLVRLLIGNMRVGANLKTVLAALAMAVVPPSEDVKAAIAQIQKTHDICPNLGGIIRALVQGGLEQMEEDCQIQLLTPIAPMLAHPAHSLEQVAKLMRGTTESDPDHLRERPMTMEWKYDGVRCQAHYDGSTVRLFSRHMLDSTEQYPDAAKACIEAATALKKLEMDSADTTSFIIDAEIVGIEVHEGKDGTTTERLLPFQDLSRRKKKNDHGQGVQVKVFAFDVMLLNGTSYIQESLETRRSVLRQHFRETENFAYVASWDLPSFDEAKIRNFLENAVQGGAEGLMMKLLGQKPSIETPSPLVDARVTTSPYEAGTRSHSWLKIKRDYVAGYADTIDVVPIGAWYGNGRKAQRSFLSPVLLAVYDEEEDVYRSISRCMSFTDAMYESMREFYFKGKAYPAGVGVDAVMQENGTMGATEENNDGDDGGADSEGDNPDTACSNADLDSAIGDGTTLVNCFPSRPSSAYVITNESPPFWFKPMEVFELSFADMTLSRQHTAGAGLVDDPEGRGVALRFPRFKRRRPDKKPEQATTSLQIAQMFGQQAKQGAAKNSRVPY